MDSEYKDAFANGVLTHTFLNVFDYHRYHFAVGGTIVEKKIIQQNVALEVEWSPEQGRYIPIDSIGWQFSQTRGYVIVDTGEFGLVVLIPMGMAQVSSVNFEATCSAISSSVDLISSCFSRKKPVLKSWYRRKKIRIPINIFLWV